MHYICIWATFSSFIMYSDQELLFWYFLSNQLCFYNHRLSHSIFFEELVLQKPKLEGTWWGNNDADGDDVNVNDDDDDGYDVDDGDGDDDGNDDDGNDDHAGRWLWTHTPFASLMLRRPAFCTIWRWWRWGDDDDDNDSKVSGAELMEGIPFPVC